MRSKLEYNKDCKEILYRRTIVNGESKSEPSSHSMMLVLMKKHLKSSTISSSKERMVINPYLPTLLLRMT